MPLNGTLQVVGYLIAIGLCSWMGRRFGAYAVLASMLPLPIAGLQLGMLLEGREEDFLDSCFAASLSLTMVVSWALSFRLAMALVGPRAPDWRPWQRAVASLAISLVLASLAAVVHLPLTVAWGRGAPETVRWFAPAVGVLCLGVAWPLLRHPRPSGAPVVPARLSMPNLLLRFAVIYGLVFLARNSTVLPLAGLFVLGSFPRGTTELVFGTWLDNDDDSAREVLAAVPLGMIPTLVWVASLPFTVPALGMTGGWAVSGALTVGAWALNVRHALTSGRTFPVSPASA